ncbi:MAG: hypothetical protein U0694_26290 [Anaerolineae bacterium]
MAIASLDTLFDELTNFLVKRPTPDEIIAFKPSEAMSRRARGLPGTQSREYFIAMRL